tara:strand:+ start:3943 stop:4068 length:126 start_codon:yes stop_codon:yes gene_type:complete
LRLKINALSKKIQKDQRVSIKHQEAFGNIKEFVFIVKVREL